MTSREPPRTDAAFRELVARVRARRELVAQAIAEGSEDIVTDRPLTAAERHAYGLDDEDGDGAEEQPRVLADDPKSGYKPEP